MASLGGWAAVHWLGGGLASLFVVMALALVIFGTTIATAIARGAWCSGGNR